MGNCFKKKREEKNFEKIPALSENYISSDGEIISESEKIHEDMLDSAKRLCETIGWDYNKYLGD